MKTLTRRSFLKNSLLTASAVSLPVHSWAQVLGANDDIRVAVVGFNGRGGGHINEFRKIKGVRVVALCDVDREVLERGAKAFQDRNESVETYTDVRKLLENKNIDAITTATPNHWHALISIWACQAGKDVYVEKPVSHNVWEGRQIVEAARKYHRIVQTGTQNRSKHAFRDAFAWLKEGNLGKIKVARGLCYKRRPSIGKTSGPQPIPESVDYDLWCGPAPNDPPRRNGTHGPIHYDWHWFWNYGCGDVGNQGIHQMDVARWALGKDALSPKVISVGGRLGYVDDGETPNTQFIVHDYGDALLIFEVRGLPGKAGIETAEDSKKSKKEVMDQYRGESVGVVVECEGGYLADTVAHDKEGKVIKKFSGGESHQQNFIDAVRSRKPSDLNADILEGHLSSALCHTGNISYRLGQQANPGEVREALKADPAALETLARFEEHLAANDVDLKKTKATLGVFLKMDPKTEKFIHNSKANELLTRHYRKPFVVPEKV
jgi:predicted dehydrogenase